MKRGMFGASRRLYGFTLVELLISLALLGILLTAVVSINIGTSQSAAALQVRNDLGPEVQIAQNYMAGKLGQAAYVFPVGAIIQMTATGKTSLNPNGSQNWVIGTDPIVAFVLPPKTVDPANPCATTSKPSQYCYAFYAFYAMKRVDYVGTATVPGVTGADNPGRSPGNDATAWILMEYRGYYSNTATSYAGTGFSQFVTEIPTGNTGRLLMDYLVPYAAAPATQLFSTNVTQTPPSSQVAGVSTVTMNLAAQQAVGTTTIRVPGTASTAFSTVTVYPRNVGKPVVNN